ncbi:hypothetical protein NUU61_002346 [Penicillium alfredii]|uniref:Uncharacterized protein n=1 Tax=Penicillium alfredii TaxID=1506179 RepID=A0A9W9KFW5_9EURO|nr:uncharacterized protein NUU61_002346 [Penicillium alfredii]KAJ5104999.1 hypothetical protein NUU61_002346 [Penicillium alfredii]
MALAQPRLASAAPTPMDGQPQSLWKVAEAQIDESEKQLLSFDQADRIDLDELSHSTQEAYQICLKKRYKICVPGKNGQEIIAQDILGKMIR